MSEQQPLQAFHLGDVLSVTTGILMSPTRMDGVYKILNFLTGDSLYTHQLPRACRECRPHVIAQHPWLDAITLESMPPDQVASTLAALVRQHGETLTLSPVPSGAYRHQHPLQELGEMTSQPIVVVSAEPQP